MLVETIKIKNNQLQRIDYHNQRLNYARKWFWNCKDEIDISKTIQLLDLATDVIYKCRISYTQNIENIEISPYEIRPIKNLKVVHANDLDYQFKYADRSALTQLFQQRGDCDDIIIVKNGFITDSYYCNLAFFDGQKWLTPAFPLLHGTQRQFLLDQQIIFKKIIKLEDLHNFQAIKLFNAMIEWEEAPVVAQAFLPVFL